MRIGDDDSDSEEEQKHIDAHFKALGILKRMIANKREGKQTGFLPGIDLPEVPVKIKPKSKWA